MFVCEARERIKIGNHDSLKSGHARTGAVIGLTSAGVTVGSCLKRFPENDVKSTMSGSVTIHH